MRRVNPLRELVHAHSGVERGPAAGEDGTQRPRGRGCPVTGRPAGQGGAGSGARSRRNEAAAESRLLRGCKRGTACRRSDCARPDRPPRRPPDLTPPLPLARPGPAPEAGSQSGRSLLVDVRPGARPIQPRLFRPCACAEGRPATRPRSSARARAGAGVPVRPCEAWRRAVEGTSRAF